MTKRKWIYLFFGGFMLISVITTEQTPLTIPALLGICVTTVLTMAIIIWIAENIYGWLYKRREKKTHV
jgi:antibiotic biosynthesis monooxygenase (ABM) superfamily enzyme